MNVGQKSVLRMHMNDRLSFFYLPWIILMSSFLINVIIGYLVPAEEKGIYTGGVASIYIYMFVAGIVILSQTFPFALGFSLRRKDYFWGTSLAILVVNATSSLGLVLLSILEPATGGWGVDLHFFHLPYFSDGNVVLRFWVNLTLLSFLFYTGLFISSIHRKLGRNGIYGFFTVVSLIITVVAYTLTHMGLWDDLFEWFASYTIFGLANLSLILTAISGFIGYMLLRRSTL